MNKDEKPEYGWYVKDLIISFSVIGFIGLAILIFGFFTQGLLSLISLIAGIVIMLLFLWPGLGMAAMNMCISDDFFEDKRMNPIKDVHAPQILDVGCGTGRTAIQIAKVLRNDGHLYGIDIYEKMAISGNALETVQKNAKLEKVNHKTTFQYGSATEIPFENNKFDIVNISSVLHEIHGIEGQIKAAKEMYRVLKPGGYLFMGEWDRSSIQTIIFTGIFCLVFKKYKYWLTLLKRSGFKRIEYENNGGFGIFTATKSN